MSFIFNLNTRIENPCPEPPVKQAVAILLRDMEKTLLPSEGIHNQILLVKDETAAEETYRITVTDDRQLTVSAGDSLGFVYGLLFISEHFLGIWPFWFWMDQKIQLPGSVEIPAGSWQSPAPAVRYRGWFLNDEVLLMHWNNGKDREFPWRMAFEALLRCGGNMVIPGTDKNSRQNAGLAASYGLWLTHHHAEPLGAEIFSRAYLDRNPSYAENPECFQKLWEDAVVKNRDKKVIWTLGYRGQGDCPFWESKGEEACDTSEKRGKRISEIIELQRQIVCKYVEHPVFCTNLYGEVMELYREGFITLHPDIIKIWADNGYGNMCTRRQGNHDARVCSLPDREDHGSHGVYYHISFHDLQAASHMTTLPNTITFVNRALRQAYDLGVDDYWIINSSNIRPHVYYLDAIRKLWSGQTVSDETHSREFAAAYYNGRESESVASCLASYAASLLSYGPYEDQHAGEQFYNYSVRQLTRQFVIDKHANAGELYWLTGDIPLWRQAEKIGEINSRGAAGITSYYEKCLHTSLSLCSDNRTRTLFDATVLLQAKIHYFCNQGAIRFCQGFLELEKGREKSHAQKCFYLLGEATQLFDDANKALRDAEYGIWKGFYENDCLTDIKFTSCLIRSMMSVVRIIGDDSRLAEWYEDFVRSKADRKVRLLTITDNHMTDGELFEVMKKSGKFDMLR